MIWTELIKLLRYVYTNLLFYRASANRPSSLTSFSFLKVFGIVNSTTDFKHQHLVMDGCSDVIMEVFGKPVGYHARSAIGTSTLPLDMVVEVEAIVQIKPE